MTEWFQELFSDDEHVEPLDAAEGMRLAASASVRAFLSSYLPSPLLADILIGLGLAIVVAYLLYRVVRMLVETGRDAWHIVRAFSRFLPRTLMVGVLALVLYVIWGIGADMLVLSRTDFPDEHRRAAAIGSKLVRTVGHATGLRGT